MALGANPRDILRLLLRESLAPVVIGLVIGLGAAMLASQVVRHLLFGIGPRDPIAMLAAAALQLAAAVLAILAPVRRAARVNLAEMLRQA
jgi:ABC-type antimicrobial peptide transport system permease subunit